MAVRVSRPSVGPLSKARVLSPRELQVMEHRSRGLAYKMIASELGISIHTTKTYAAQAFAKLNARTSLEAVRILFLERAAL